MNPPPPQKPAELIRTYRGEALLTGRALREIAELARTGHKVYYRRDGGPGVTSAALVAALVAEASISALPQTEYCSACRMKLSSADRVDLVTVEEAATMLRRTPRRVRQLAAALDGIKIDNRWQFPRSAVAERKRKYP